jgi:hypothetical protein
MVRSPQSACSHARPISSAGVSQLFHKFMLALNSNQLDNSRALLQFLQMLFSPQNMLGMLDPSPLVCSSCCGSTGGSQEGALLIKLSAATELVYSASVIKIGQFHGASTIFESIKALAS